ncbi:ATP-binding protein, partial [Streptomyces tendae]
MDGDGTRDARGTHANPVPRPAGPPEVPAKPPEAPTVPPRPARAPGAPDGSAFLTWLRTPRPQALPGVWRFGHRPRPEEEPERVPGRQLLSGAVIAFLVGWLIWSLLWNGYLGGWWLLPLYAMIPDSWAEPHSFTSVVVVYAYYVLIAGIIMVGVGRLGRWSEIWRRYGPPAWRRAVPGAVPAPAPEEDPAAWPALRA